MHDIFFRKENFENEPWYEQLLFFTRIGVCCPDKEEHFEPLQDALRQLGYEEFAVFQKDGKKYLAGRD